MLPGKPVLFPEDDGSSLLSQVEVYNASSGWSVLGFRSLGKRTFASAVAM